MKYTSNNSFSNVAVNSHLIDTRCFGNHLVIINSVNHFFMIDLIKAVLILFFTFLILLAAFCSPGNWCRRQFIVDQWTFNSCWWSKSISVSLFQIVKHNYCKFTVCSFCGKSAIIMHTYHHGIAGQGVISTSYSMSYDVMGITLVITPAKASVIELGWVLQSWVKISQG